MAMLMMKNFNICSNLDKIPNQETSWYSWMQASGEWKGLTSFKKKFLMKSDTSAYSLPCTACEAHCPRQIKRFSDGTIEAICKEDPMNSLRLKHAQIEVWQLNKHAFHEALTKTLGISFQQETKASYLSTWRLGEYKAAEKFYPAYVTYSANENSFEKVVAQLASINDCFILLAPSRRNLREYSENLIRNRNAVFLAFEETFSLTDDSELLPLTGWNKSFMKENQATPSPKTGISISEAAKIFVTFANSDNNKYPEEPKNLYNQWRMDISRNNSPKPIGMGKRKAKLYNVEDLTDFIIQKEPGSILNRVRFIRALAKEEQEIQSDA